MMSAPDFLTSLPRWVLWRETKQTGRKSTKVPFSMNGGMASSTNSRDWSDYSTVQAALARAKGAWDGAGITLGDLSNGEVLAGIDLDSCLGDDGVLAEWAKPYLRVTNSYTEISPSGQGLKIVFRLGSADLPLARRAFFLSDDENGRKKTHGIGNGHPPAAEVYFSGRYFTITEHAWHETPNEVSILSADALQKLGDLFGPRDRQSSSASSEGIDQTECDAGALLGKIADALARRHGLRERWLGSAEGLTDKSRSGFDMSLGGMLKAAGFTFGEMRAALILSQHGAGKEKADDDRYFTRIWSRTAAERPEPSPGGGIGGNRRAGPEGRSSESVIPINPWDALRVPAFADYLLPKVLRDFVSDRSDAMGAGKAGLAWSAISACSCALHGRTRLKMKRNDRWSVPPAIWVALIGSVSAMKTPIVEAGWAPLEEEQGVELDSWRRAHDEWKSIPRKQRDKIPEPVAARRLFTKNATTESVQDILSRQDRGLGIFRDELSGFIGSMEEYKGGKGSDRSFWLEAFNGKPYVVDRIGRGTSASSNLLVAVIGGIPPHQLLQFKGLTDDGLFQRFVPILVPAAGNGSDLHNPGPHLNYHAAVQRLLNVPSGVEVSLSDEAHCIREDVHQRLLQDVRSEALGAPYAGFCGKLIGLWGRLCLVLHFLEPSPGHEVSGLTADIARELIFHSVMPNAARVYTAMGGGGADMETTQSIAGYILSKGKQRVLASELARDVRACRGKGAFAIRQFMDPLTVGAWVAPEDEENPISWTVFPIVHEHFKDRAEKEKANRKRILELIRDPEEQT